MDNQAAAAPAQHRTAFVTSATIRNETWNYLCNLTIMLMLGILLSCTASTAAAPADNRAVSGNSSGTDGVQILKRAAPDVAAITAGLVLGRETTTKDVATAAAAAGAAPMQNPSTDMTSDQPQGQCLLDGEYVPETTVFCEKQIGCRAIQKTGYCCPDYKCDCEKDGITYANGDKLVDPETPCTVCYCQGGEILCSSVTCFHRDDCTPKYIAGVCCPEYDNCPVAASETAVNNTFSATSTTTMKPEISNGILSQKITIKEITKPIEIRITDDNKAIPIPQMLKPAATVMTTTHTTSTTTNAAAAVAADTSAIPPSTTTTTITTTTTAPTPTPSSITIITTTTISAHKEKSPITNMNAINIETPTSNNTHNLLETNVPTKLMAVSTDNNQISRNKANGGESLKLTASVAYASAEQQQPATNLSEGSREMDDTVPSLSVFASQGSSQDPTKVNIKREYLVNTNNTNTQASDGNNNSNNNDEAHDAKSLYNHKIENGKETEEMLQTNGENSEELDSDTAGSDNIYHIVLTTDGPHVRSTTEDSILEKFPLPEQPKESVMDKYSMNAFNKSSIDTIPQHLNHMEEDDNIVVAESNPAYPSLPEDDFSLRDINFQLTDSDDLSYEPHSVALGGAKFDMIKNITTVEDNHYDGGSGLLMDELIAVSSTAERKNGPNLHKSIISDSLIKEKVNRKLQTTVQLIDSAEDSLPENINVITDHDKKPEKIERIDVSSSGENENGSGAGEITTFNNKNNTERESTTVKPNKRLEDIDGELSDGSGDGKSLVNDPKWDAESIKLEENRVHSPLSTLDNASSNDVSSDKA